MDEAKLQPGFRLSAVDVLVLVVGAIGAGLARDIDHWASVAILWVVLHFFLFCNVLRMSRPLELIWAAVFITLAIAAIRVGTPGWPVVFAVSAAVTVIVAILQLRMPSYHGVVWQRLNPELPAWWRAKHGDDAPRERPR